jgi:hypothetical protein
MDCQTLEMQQQGSDALTIIVTILFMILAIGASYFEEDEN